MAYGCDKFIGPRMQPCIIGSKLFSSGHMEEVRLRSSGLSWAECLKAQVRAREESSEIDLLLSAGMGEPIM